MHSHHVPNLLKEKVMHAPSISVCFQGLGVLFLVRLNACTHCADGFMSHPPVAKIDMNSQAIMKKKGGFSGFFIRQAMGIDPCLMFWADCSSKGIVLWFVQIYEDFVGSSASEKDCAQVLSIIHSMEASSQSTGSLSPTQFIEIDIKEMKNKIKKINKVPRRIASEGAHRFDNVYKDKAHVKK